MVTAYCTGRSVMTERSGEAQQLERQSHFGAAKEDGRVVLSPFEALFLLETKRIRVLDGRGRVLSHDALKRRLLRAADMPRYAVFADLRRRGYVVKTALKYGADFRVYNRGDNPGKQHARWLLYVAREQGQCDWRTFSAQNRVAHSAKKSMLFAVVDDEDDITYWEARWLRP